METDKLESGLYWVRYCDLITVGEYHSEPNVWWLLGSSEKETVDEVLSKVECPYPDHF